MSRIGKKIITLPEGVAVEVHNQTVVVSGQKGKLSQEVDKTIKVLVDGKKVSLTRLEESDEVKAKHGLFRALINNMVNGVSNGFSKKLEINGVGYKASVEGKKLVLNLGHSHNITVDEVEGVSFSCPSQTEIVVTGIDRQLVGQVASNIRDLRPVEPYHAYGVKYANEIVIKKVGKTAGKGKK